MQGFGDESVPGEARITQMARETARGDKPSFLDKLGLVTDIIKDAPGYALKKSIPEGSLIDRVKKSVSEAGRNIADSANKELAQNQPKVQGAIAQFGIDVTRAVIDMVPAVTAGAVTKNVGTTMAIMGAQGGGNAYADYIDRGMSPGEAMAATRFKVLAELRPESIPVTAILKRGTPLAKRLFDATIGEGAQEMITSTLEQYYDARVLAKMILKEAISKIDWGKILYEGAVGVAVGGTVACVARLAGLGR